MLLSRRPTDRGQILWPSRLSSAANTRTLLRVHRNGDMGSPRVVGPARLSSAGRSVGSLSPRRLAPPPAFRILPGARSGGARSSPIPLAMVFRETPVAADTADIDRAPSVFASEAAARRRTLSFIMPDKAPNRFRIPSSRTSRSFGDAALLAWPSERIPMRTPPSTRVLRVIITNGQKSPANSHRPWHPERTRAHSPRRHTEQGGPPDTALKSKAAVTSSASPESKLSRLFLHGPFVAGENYAKGAEYARLAG